MTGNKEAVTNAIKEGAPISKRTFKNAMLDKKISEMKVSDKQKGALAEIFFKLKGQDRIDALKRYNEIKTKK